MRVRRIGLPIALDNYNWKPLFDEKSIPFFSILGGHFNMSSPMPNFEMDASPTTPLMFKCPPQKNGYFLHQKVPEPLFDEKSIFLMKIVKAF